MLQVKPIHKIDLVLVSHIILPAGFTVADVHDLPGIHSF